jgi:hypothetical protein
VKRVTPDEADQLALYMERPWYNDLTTHAAGLQPDEKKEILLALQNVESEAAKLAPAARSARQAQAYERMAVSARRADQRIRQMLKA